MKANETATQPYIVPRKRIRKRARFWLILTPFLVLGTGAGVLGAKLQTSNGKVAAHLSVASIPLGGKSKQEAQALLDQYAQEILNKKLSLRLPAAAKSQRVWRPDAQTLGLSVNVSATMQALLKASETNFFQQVMRVFASPTPERLLPVASVDLLRVTSYLKKRVAPKCAIPPVNAKMNPNTRPFAIVEGRDGMELDSDASSKAIETAWKAFYKSAQAERPLAEDPLEVELSVKTAAPAITRADLEQIDGDLGRFSTHFGGTGASRGSNIATATSSINGTLIAPGKIFSYNDVVGPRTASRGFREAPVIIKGELVPGIGGGICQVSTTLYNAALLANLKIVRRSHHAFPVHYVPAGRDATVVDGAIDFQFQNNTSAPIYISASSSRGVLEFRILGKKASGRSVSLELADHTVQAHGTVERPDPTLPEGKRVVKDSGHRGHKVALYRVVKDNGEVRRELISRDTYRPFPAIILKGTQKRAAPSNPISPTPTNAVPSPIDEAPNEAPPDTSE